MNNNEYNFVNNNNNIIKKDLFVIISLRLKERKRKYSLMTQTHTNKEFFGILPLREKFAFNCYYY